MPGTQVTTDTITIKWAKGSPLTTSFNVYGKRTINSRDLDVGVFSPLQNSTATSCQVTSLASGAFYTFVVYAVRFDGVVSSSNEITIQTTSQSSASATLPPGGA